MKRHILAGLLSLSAWLGGTATSTADEAAFTAMGYCKEFERYINLLVEFTRTECIPALSSDGTDFIFVSARSIFAVEKAKQGWILTVVGAVGKTLDDHPTYKARTLFLADAEMAKQLRYMTMPAALSKDLSRQIRSDQITLETMWSRISASMKPYTAPKRK